MEAWETFVRWGQDWKRNRVSNAEDKQTFVLEERVIFLLKGEER